MNLDFPPHTLIFPLSALQQVFEVLANIHEDDRHLIHLGEHCTPLHHD